MQIHYVCFFNLNMNLLQKNVSLKLLHTFRTDVSARYYARVTQLDDFSELLMHYPADAEDLLILGGGSNLLFTRDYEGLVIQPEMRGIEVVRENDQFVYVKAYAAEDWDGFVSWCVAQGYGGLENLSLIPGRVGATPIQNIGAYGAEVSDVIDKVEAVSIQTGEQVVFRNEECLFGYRDSYFKHQGKDSYMIVSVVYKLAKEPVLNLDYPALAVAMEAYPEANIHTVRQAVVEIRQKKLPDPALLGNAGSFFKNPMVPKVLFDRIKDEYPDLPGHRVSPDVMKIPAAWLIQQCGWKGKRVGDAGIYANQSLVLVNYGNALGKEIFDLSQRIMWSVESEFGISLDTEVNVL